MFSQFILPTPLYFSSLYSKAKSKPQTRSKKSTETNSSKWSFYSATTSTRPSYKKHFLSTTPSSKTRFQKSISIQRVSTIIQDLWNINFGNADDNIVFLALNPLTPPTRGAELFKILLNYHHHFWLPKSNHDYQILNFLKISIKTD